MRRAELRLVEPHFRLRRRPLLPHRGDAWTQFGIWIKIHREGNKALRKGVDKGGVVVDEGRVECGERGEIID